MRAQHTVNQKSMLLSASYPFYAYVPTSDADATTHIAAQPKTMTMAREQQPKSITATLVTAPASQAKQQKPTLTATKFLSARHSHPRQYAAAFYSPPAHLNGDFRSPANSKLSLLSALASLAYYATLLALLGLTIYALSVSYTTTVVDACGNALLIVTITRVLLTVVEVVLVYCFASGRATETTASGGASGSPAAASGEANNSLKRGTATTSSDTAKSATGCFVILFHLVFLGVGAFYASQAMNNEACSAAMASVSATKSPLLGILGYVYVGVDALFALATCLTCLGVLASTASTETSASDVLPGP